MALAPTGGYQMTPGYYTERELFAQTAADIRQRLLGQGGARSRSAQMSKAEQFREFADEAFQWSRKAKTEAARQILLGLAFTWIQAALISERTFVGPLRA